MPYVLLSIRLHPQEGTSNLTWGAPKASVISAIKFGMQLAMY